MSNTMAVRPRAERKSSRVPGQFETESEMASEYAGDENPYDDESADNLSSLLPASMDATSFLPRADVGNNTFEEQEMHKKLTDIESSSLPELSHIAPTQSHSTSEDDTFRFGAPNDNLATRRRPTPIETSSPLKDIKSEPSEAGNSVLRSPQTPPGAYKTPGPEEQMARLRAGEDELTPEAPHTSSLETMSSSPTARAAARTVSRVQSMTTMGGYETADESRTPHSPTRSVYHNSNEDLETTPRKADNRSRDLDNESPTRYHMAVTSKSTEDLSQSDRLAKRPKYLKSRTSAQRLSYSSITSSNTDTASDATLGADFALQSGGALPEPRLQRKPKMTLSRSTSLGSMASGISALSDEDVTRSKRAGGGTSELEPLAEERPISRRKRSADELPLTPKASTHSLAMPTDTVIANNVRDLEIPGTFARQYRQQNRSVSPDKLSAGMTPGPARNGKGMTLKEHRSTVERLGKENFDLKMKIHFLDQALQMRSEDGVKQMITENVQLKSDRMRLEKDNHTLRKQVRELQKKLEESNAANSPDADQGYATDEERSPTAEEEVIYLRERLETTEIEIEKMRTESIARENEKRRLAEMVKSLGDTRAVGSEVGSREERDMWKDMLEAETIAREQSEEDNKKLRDEIAKLRNDSARSSLKKNRMPGSVVSRDSSTDGRNGAASSVVEQLELQRLRHEVSELQKMIGAQASTLTSRNKEKERLYQEIEDLKIGRMGGHGVRSIAGDSIFERSASRARSNSRASNGTRISRISDPERESFENKIGELRDQVSELKLENQNLKSQVDEIVAELDAVDAQAQADADQFNEELQLLTLERDDALHAAEEQDVAFQNLKAEAQEEIDGLGDELDAKVEECARLEQELKTQEENVQSLQNEMRSASEGLLRLEEDAQQNRSLYKNVQAELDDANRELENMEKNLAEAESKIQRLTVQQESSHNEIAFLREEQDADKIKIGDLEGLLKSTHLNLNTERDRSKELDRRLAEERHQREVVGGKEKQEVQRVINDLNREAAAAKDETRRIKKALSSRELEANTWKERLMDLEGSLREALGDLNGTRSSLLSSVTKMQRELDNATIDLDATRRRLDEKETLLAKRDELLESSGLEYRKIADLLDRERQARRADKNSFEQALKSHQQSTKALTANNSRIADLESARQADRRRLTQLEQQFKDQLAERNAVLLTIWKRLSSLCGPDWAHSNSLINGNLPSQEVIGNMLFWPGFSRNLLLAAKQVEGVLVAIRDRMKGVERNLWQEYQGLEQTLELRTKKLERIEELFNNMKLSQDQTDAQRASRSSRSSSGKSPELQKLKGENRLLKAELSLLQQQHSHVQHSRRQSRSSLLPGSEESGIPFNNTGIPTRGSSARGQGAAGTTSAAMTATLMRHHSTNVVEHLTSAGNSDQRSMRSNSVSSRTSNSRGELMIAAPQNGNHPPMSATGSDAGAAGQEKWIHRLRELERRLKAEREARLLDRSGARKRLEERDAVNEQLRRELEREKTKREAGAWQSDEQQEG